MKIGKKAAVFVLLVLLPSLSFAQLYRCNIKGSTVYQEVPCEGGRKLDVPTTSSPPPPETSKRLPNPDSPLARLAKVPAFQEYIFNVAKNERCKPFGIDESARLGRVFELKLMSARRLILSPEVSAEYKTAARSILSAAQSYHPTQDQIKEYAAVAIDPNADPEVLRSSCSKLPRLLEKEVSGIEGALQANKLF